jgi:hypothetical protein
MTGTAKVPQPLSAFPRYPAIGTSDRLRDCSQVSYRRDLMPQPSPKMRELRTALAVALGLAIAAFGTAIVAANYVAQ